ncbi:P2 family phage major capsid protein [Salmonella enterica]|nr:P2 family phage major capsid protein [Salmonella enterica]ELT1526471.1 P2 family phage major capsid protein [Salmonella enterica]
MDFAEKTKNIISGNEKNQQDDKELYTHPSYIMQERIIEELSGIPGDKLNFSSDAAIVPPEMIQASPGMSGEIAATWSAAFLSEINTIPVNDDKGSVLYVGPVDPIARTGVRKPMDSVSMEPRFYHCRQVNFDFYISYDDIDRFSGVKNYPQMVRAAVEHRRSLDRLHIGFNGLSRAEFLSDPYEFPDCRDCKKGWLEKYRSEAPERVIDGLSVSSDKAPGTHGTIDGLVFDVWDAAIDERWQHDLVAVCNYSILHKKYFPLINNLDTSQMNQEILVNQELIKKPMLGNIPAVTAPFFPENTVLVTSLKNLSLYWQNGSIRRFIKNEPDYNRIAFYESANEDYIVENYDAGCLIEGIEWK